MANRTLLVVLAVCIVGLAGCPELKDLRRQNKNLKAQLEQCQTERDEYLSQVSGLQSERDRYQEQVQEARRKAGDAEQLVEQLRQEQQKLEDQRRELQGLVRNLSGISVESGREGNFIVLENEILFALGKTELNEDAKASLDQVAGYLRQKPDVAVRIDGHTDGVPIKVSDWKDNYHLSAMRAHAVMGYLVEQGLDPGRMHIAGFGPNRPRVEPDSPTAAVPANRRVEILVVPEGTRSIGDILEEFED